MKTTPQHRNTATPQHRYVLLLISVIMFTYQLKAQTTPPEIHYYYIEEASYDLLKPNNIIVNQDKTLELQFNKQSLTDFFDDFTIHSFEREYEWSRFTSLHKYYLIGLDDTNKINDLLLNNDIVLAEYVGTIEDFEGNTLSTPNDYFEHSALPNYWIPDGTFASDGDVHQPYQLHNIRGYEHLELINARQAWNITTGNPSVVIGIRDINFNQLHPEIAGKINATYGTMSTTEGGHGVSVAGTAAGNTNNTGIGLSSIGYDSSLIFVTGSNAFTSGTSGYAGTSLFLAENHNDIKVINISMGSSSNSFLTPRAEAFQHIKDSLNVTVVVAAGNGNYSGSNITDYYYPASYEHVISVSSVGSYNNYGHVHDNGASVDWKDVHEQVIGNSAYNHQHNDSIDIVAPGYTIPVPRELNSYMIGRGTSYAAPIVSGVAALMYAAHPNITAAEVKEILQNTAEDIFTHIPENWPYIGKLGAGRVNAYAAVLQAQCMENPTTELDLMTRNSEDDYGDEADTATQIIWDSSDIWFRNQPDGHLYKTSEDFNFIDNTTPVYVYVKVTNNSCDASSGNELLELYWAKGGLSQNWPNVWDGSSNLNPNTPVGDQVNTLTIPILQPGQSTIIEFEWQPLNPQVYENAGFNKPWMFCFLSRIVTNADPMAVTEGSNAALNARNNNNIAYKNATVINVAGRPSTGSIVVGNVGSAASLTSNVQFFTNTLEDANLWQDAEVRLELDSDLWNLWQNSGAQFSNVRVLDPAQRLILLTANNASLNNIVMQSDEWGIATLGVNFLVNVVDAQENYRLHVQQVASASQEVFGGFSYTFLRDNQRQAFNAGTSRTSNANGSETFNVQDINEEAIYNWYDEDGVLIYSGSDFTVSNLVAKEYKLEVIAESDGHKDYKTVATEDKRGIEYISPNPASSGTVISYTVASTDTVYIMLTHSTTGMQHNFILNAVNNSITLPTSLLAQGQYVVNLVANGIMIDAKHLIIN